MPLILSSSSSSFTDAWARNYNNPLTSNRASLLTAKPYARPSEKQKRRSLSQKRNNNHHHNNRRGRKGYVSPFQTLPCFLTKIDPPQGSHVISVLIRKNEMELRESKIRPLRDDQLLAPLGGEECFAITQYSMLYTLRNDPDYSNFRLPATAVEKANVVSNVVAFEVVNGLPKGARLKKVGNIAINAMQSVAWHIGMSTTTAYFAGSVPYCNTGPYKCMAMSNVYFDERPYAYYDPKTGKLRPYTYFAGGPGTAGEDPKIVMKFVPATYTMETGDAAALIFACTREIDAVLDHKKMCEPSFRLTVREYESKWAAFADKASQLMMERPPSLPLMPILKVHFFCVMLLYVMIHDNDDSDGKVLERIRVDVYKQLVQDMNGERDAMNQAMGQPMGQQGTQAPLFQVFSDEFATMKS